MSNSEVINDEIIDDLAEENEVNVRDILEIENKINKKREELNKFKVNSDRAKRASVSLLKKAEEAEAVISRYENRIKNLSQSSR